MAVTAENEGMGFTHQATSFQSAIRAAAPSRVDIRNLLTDATVRVRAEDMQAPTR